MGGFRQLISARVCACLLFLLIGIFQPVKGQEKFRISGGLNGSAIGYHAWGTDARRDPFYWLMGGNLTLSYWKITAPFSFSVSQQDQTFRYPQPFNQFGISPSYKYITLHLGYRSMNFSEFTLAGNIFLGVGADVAPPNTGVKVSAMYGRLAKARLEGGINDLEYGIASYERWGYGTKVTLGKNGQEVDLIVFRGRDDPGSLPDSAAAQLGIKPAENFVWGVNVRQNLGSRVTVNAEYAMSAYTQDVRDPEVTLSHHRYANFLGGLYNPTVSSQFNGAFQGQVAYQAGAYQLNAKYRRLGPDYRTMGSPFMTNDFEDITGGVGTALMQGRLNLSGNAGVQRNNLTGTQAATMKRFIGSANVAYTFSQQVSANISYSNFNSSSKQERFYQQSQTDRIDSLLYLQVTNSLNGGVNWNLASADSTTQSLSLTGNYQVASDNQGSKSVFYTANVGYQWNLTPRDFTLATSVNFNSNKVAGIENLSGGPMVSVSKLFLKKVLKTSLATAYIQTWQAQASTGDNLTARATCAYATKSKHTFGVDVSYLQRNGRGAMAQSFTEVRGGITYNYSFSN